MPKKRKQHTPIVPVRPVEAPHIQGDAGKSVRKKPKKTKHAAEGGERAVVWLHGSLRVRDNAILTRAAELGPGGLEIIVVWRHGRKVPTPAASFMAAALRSLHSELKRLGSGLTVLIASTDSDAAAAEAVAAHVLRLGGVAPANVIVDACGPSGADVAALLGRALPDSSVSPMVDDTLFPHDVAISCLPRSRVVDEDATRALQWAGFLKAVAKLPVPPPSTAPIRLPPPLSPAVAELNLPRDSAWWGEPTLNGWLEISAAPISEAGAMSLAAAAAARVQRNGRNGFAPACLGEKAGAGDDAAGKSAPRPAYISPFLAWGVLSPRQAAAAGVRRRDLLWRDFSRLCWRVRCALRTLHMCMFSCQP